MCECKPPSAALSAGAMTSANRIGVSIGTAIWRGFWAVRAARRAAPVPRARPTPARGACEASGRPGRVAVAAMRSSLGSGWSGGGGEAGAGEAEVHVVERGPAARHGDDGEAGAVEGGDG